MSNQPDNPLATITYPTVEDIATESLGINRKTRKISHVSSSYYNLKSAKIIMPILDSMIKNHEEHTKDPSVPLIVKRIPFKDLGVKPKTVQMKISQGWAWLCENYDNDGKYRKLKGMTKITEEVNDGCALLIVWRATTSGKTLADICAEDVLADDVVAEVPRNWIDDLYEWLKTKGPRKPVFEKSGVKITDEYLRQLRDVLDKGGYAHQITPTTVLIVAPQEE